MDSHLWTNVRAVDLGGELYMVETTTSVRHIEKPDGSLKMEDETGAFADALQEILDKLDHNGAMLSLLLRAKLHEIRRSESKRQPDYELAAEIEQMLEAHRSDFRIGMRRYPYEDGEALVLAPELLIDPEMRVISFRGAQFVKVDEDVPRD